MADLNVIAEGELVAFLAFWLSRFFLPHAKKVKARNIFNGCLDGFWVTNFFRSNGAWLHLS